MTNRPICASQPTPFGEAPGRRAVRQPGVAEQHRRRRTRRGTRSPAPGTRRRSRRRSARAPRPGTGRSRAAPPSAGTARRAGRPRPDRDAAGQLPGHLPGDQQGESRCTACSLSRVTPSTDGGSLRPDSPSSMPAEQRAAAAACAARRRRRPRRSARATRRAAAPSASRGRAASACTPRRPRC